MMRFIIILIVAVLAQPAFAAQNRPNIVLIMADDLGWGDLGCYPKGKAWGEEAYTPTPHLDRLAASGVRFTQAYATCMVCSPSRAGLLTGQYQQRFGFYGFGETCAPLPRHLKLLPQALREAGYHTGMVGKWHISTDSTSIPLQRGFDRFFGFLGGQHDYFEANVGVTYPGGDYTADAYIFDQDKPVAQVKYLTEEFTDRALGFLAGSVKSDKPFFLYLAYNDPHPPNQAPWDDLKPYADKRPNGKFTTRDIARASIGNIDRNVGRLVQWLRDQKIETNTLIMFTSDNGGSDGGPDHVLQHNGGLRGRKSTFYEGGIRIPLLASWPGHLPAGTVYTNPVSHLDVYPTALAVAGPAAKIETQPLDGVNIIPFVTGKNSAVPHKLFYWSADSSSHWAVRDGDWKLILEDVEPETLGKKARERKIKLQLYDLAADPREENDLAGNRTEVVQRLQARFQGFVAESKPSIYTDEVKAAHQAVIAAQARQPILRTHAGAPDHWLKSEKK